MKYNCPICNGPMKKPEKGLRIIICYNNECKLYGNELTESGLEAVHAAIAATRAQALSEAAQEERDARRIGWEDVLGWFETWEPLINPTVADVESAVKGAVKDARRYLSCPAPEPAPKCPQCGWDMQRGNTWLCIFDGATEREATHPRAIAEPEKGLLS